jgi:hypothetical protein
MISARRCGDVKTPKSRRSLILSKQAIATLHDHRKRQAGGRLTIGEDWQANGLAPPGAATHPNTDSVTNAARNHAMTCTRAVRPRGADHTGPRHL